MAAALSRRKGVIQKSTQIEGSNGVVEGDHEGEGEFPGMERLPVQRGSVVIWDCAKAEGESEA